MKQEYGITLNNNNKKPATFKTKKMFSSFGKPKKAKVANAMTLRELKISVPRSNEKNENESDDNKS